MHLKIPLEVFTAAAIAVLMLAVWNAPQPGKYLTEAPGGSPPVRLAKEAPADRVKPLPKEEAYRIQSGLESVSLQPTEREEETIQLALLVEPETPAKTFSPQAAREAAPAPEERKKGIEEEETRMAYRPRKDIATQAVPETDPSFSHTHEVLSEVKNLIRLAEGTVISEEYEEQTQRPQSISAMIPVEKYQMFTEELRRLAVLKAPSTALPQKGDKVVSVRIRFITAE